MLTLPLITALMQSRTSLGRQSTPTLTVMLFLLPTALAFAPGLTPTPTPRARVTSRALAPVCVDGSLIAEMSDQAKYAGAAAAALFLGGGLYLGTMKPKSASSPTPAPAPAAAAPVAAPVEPPPPAAPVGDWYVGKRSLGTHRMAGRWPGDAKRELWVPPPGWQPASKAAAKPAAAGVNSWYDSGVRLGPNGVNY